MTPDLAILLPPSETKLAGGGGPALRLEALAYDDQLSAVRKQLLDAVVDLAGDPVAARAALGLSERQDGQVALNARLWTGETAPAIRRYTGVLYDALGYRTLPAAARRRADDSLFVASALFGVLAAADPVPAYRLSCGSALPGLPTLGALWRAALTPVLAGLGGLVLDLRSTGYVGLAAAPGAITVRVLSERPDGGRSIVSHFSKHHKGVLVRALLHSRATITDERSLVRVIRRAGLTVEASAPGRLDLVVPAP
ncbi:MAG: uncharacterized protein JWO79_2419 [Actinomycetia bacterium]|nr:uncharacterized protein [Actinomycetes bacterium]